MISTCTHLETCFPHLFQLFEKFMQCIFIIWSPAQLLWDTLLLYTYTLCPFLLFFKTHQVQFVLPIFIRLCGLQREHVRSTKGYTFKEYWVSLSSMLMAIAPRDFMPTSHLHAQIGLRLNTSCVSYCNHCEFVCIVALLYPANTFLVVIYTSGSYNISTSHSAMILKHLEKMQYRFSEKHSTVSNSPTLTRCGPIC